LQDDLALDRVVCRAAIGMQDARPRDQSGLHPGLARPPPHPTGAVKDASAGSLVLVLVLVVVLVVVVVVLVASKIRHLTDVSA
jgi:hypothetical protein